MRTRTLFFAAATAATFALALPGCSGPPYSPAHSALLAPAPAGVTRGQDRFVGVHNTEIVEQWWRPAAPRATLAIVHGLRDHGARYQELGERLALDENIAVYAMDLRGHAHSAGTRADVEDFNDYLTDLDAFVGRVRFHEPAGPLFIFGFSMGGAIVTRYAETRHAGVDGFILAGAALKVDVGGAKVFGTKLVATLSPDSGIFSLDPEQFTRDRAVVDAGRADPNVYQDGGTARLARELVNSIDTAAEHFEDITQPILVMHGSADTVTPPDGSKELVARARSRDKTLKIFDGYWHDLLHEPSHEKVIVEIETWLHQRVPNAPSK